MAGMTALPPLPHEPDMMRYYTERFSERDRLASSAHGRLEFLRTQELLRRYLPEPPGSLLDVGGGPGTHARWLAEDGYQVHVIDPVARHVAQSAAIDGVTASVGDARDLAVEPASADAVLLLGPLYHLVDRRDRIAALRAARRAVRPGGPVFAAAISRYAELLDLTRRGLLVDDNWSLVRSTLRTGQHNARLGFTDAHFHHANELRSELVDAGLSEVELFGLEGPAWQSIRLEPAEEFDRMLPMVLDCAREVECDPAMIAASQHLLAIGCRA